MSADNSDDNFIKFSTCSCVKCLIGECELKHGCDCIHPAELDEIKITTTDFRWKWESTAPENLLTNKKGDSMPTKEKTKLEFKEDVLKVLQETPIGGNMKSQIRVVRFHVNGEPKEIKLEKRTIITSDGRDRMGRSTGFTKADWEFLLKIKENVSELFG